MSFQVVVGLEEMQRADSRLTDVVLNQASLTEVLNQLVKADPEYSWRVSNDGAVHVQSLEPPPTLGEVVLLSFSIDNLYRREVSTRLDEQTEVHAWLNEHGCRRVEYTIGGDWSDDKTRISFLTTGKTLRENLDITALNAGTYFWSIARRDFIGCEISIKF